MPQSGYRGSGGTDTVGRVVSKKQYKTYAF